MPFLMLAEQSIKFKKKKITKKTFKYTFYVKKIGRYKRTKTRINTKII